MRLLKCPLVTQNWYKELANTSIGPIIDGGPYIHQTRLGWCIVGSIIDMVSKKSIDCNHIVIDVMSSNISSHHFVIEEPMKELSLEEMFQTMQNNDFNDISTTKLNNGVIKDVERFPVKTDNSFRQLKKRQQWLVNIVLCLFLFWMRTWKWQKTEKLWKDWCTSFKRNLSFFADYMKLMDDLVAKGYASKEDKTTWKDLVYPIPWGVPRKQAWEIQSGAEFDEWSLNKELLTRPDLTNQIVGVLAKFWQNSIAFMAGIEVMYYRWWFLNINRAS